MNDLSAKLQVRTSQAVHTRLKVLAAQKGVSVTDLVLEGLTKIDDAELKKLIAQGRPKPGRPTK